MYDFYKTNSKTPIKSSKIPPNLSNKKKQKNKKNKKTNKTRKIIKQKKMKRENNKSKRTSKPLSNPFPKEKYKCLLRISISNRLKTEYWFLNQCKFSEK